MIRRTPLAFAVAATLFLVAFSSFFAVFPSSARGAEKVAVQCCWPEGSYTIRQEIFTSLIKALDKEVVVREQTKAQFVWSVEASELENGVQRLALRATQITLVFEGNEREPFYSNSDGRLNAKPYEQEIYKKFQSVPIFVAFKNGEVESVEGCDELWKGIRKPEDERSQFFLSALQNVATPESFGEVFKQFAYPLPLEPVAVGDVWTTAVEYEIPPFGMQNVVWNSKLNGVAPSGRDRLANVKSEATLKLNDGANATVKISVDAKYNLDKQTISEFASRATVSSSVQGVEQDAESGAKKNVEVKTTALLRNMLTVVKR